MAMKSYGRISISNVKQVGTLSVNPTCNMPLQVIYDPNNNTYIPDWAKTNLVIEPVVTFDGTVLSSGYTVKFKKRDGSSAESEITASSGAEAVSNNKLTVSSNILKDSVYGMITYTMEVSYVVPKVNKTISTTASLTFSLVKNPETVKYASINGENVFLYNTKQQIQGNSTITLEGYVTNVTISAWQYKNSSGEWVNYPTTNNPDGIDQNTLIVSESDPVFFNDKAIIKLTTSDANIFDIITISKIRDGAAGEGSVVIVLSNDSHIVPADSNGNALTMDGASTRVYIYEGGIDVTDDYEFEHEANPKTLSYQYIQSSHTFTVNDNGMPADLTVAKIIITATKKDGSSSPLITTFTLTKIKAGMDGEDAVIYRLNVGTGNDLVIHRDTSGNLSPNYISFISKTKIGLSKEQKYNARFYIYETSVANASDEDWTLTENSTVDENVRSYIPSESAVAVKCYLLKPGSTEVTDDTILDSQTVAIVQDGPKGEDGEAGKGGLSAVLGNEAELITCGSDLLVSEDQTITIPYDTYEGITKIFGTAEIVGSLPDGMTLNGSITGSSPSASGVVTIKVAKGSNLDGLNRGEINIRYNFKETESGSVIGSVIKKFSWAKNPKGADGKDAVIMQLYAPNGDVIINKTNSVTIACMIVDGSTLVDSGVTYAWYKFDGSDYVLIPGKTESTLIVAPDMVDTMGYFKCIANYKGIDHAAYYTVSDRSDPYDVSVYSSIGTNLFNSDKIGAIFTRVLRNGAEVDSLKSTYFGETAPSNPSSGDFYYKLSKSDESCVLMKYNGSTWTAASDSDLPKLTYKYFRLDSTGNVVDLTTPWKTGKAIYFDSAQIGDDGLDLVIEVSD